MPNQSKERVLDLASIGGAGKSTEFGEQLACSVASAMLAKSKGKQRAKIWTMGPAIWNRGGEDTSTTHCLQLIETIMLEHGFAHYRYDVAWKFGPNPKHPLEVWEHAESMRSRNNLLPELPKQELDSIFRRVHLLTSLQMQDQGGRKLPKSGKILNKTLANAEAIDVFKNGMWVLHFDYQDVVDNLEEFKKLCASDNWDAFLTLGDDPLSLATRMRKKIEEGKFEGSGTALDQAVVNSIKEMSGKALTDQDYNFLLQWAKTTCAEAIDFLSPLQKFLCDPTQYVVPASFFSWMAEVDPAFQMIRICQDVRMWGADTRLEKGEVKVVNDKIIAQAVNQKQVENMSKNIKAMSVGGKESNILKIESALDKVVKTYWNALPKQMSANEILPHLGAIFKKVGKLMSAQDAVFDDVMKAFAIQEWKMRSSILGRDGDSAWAPTPVLPEPPEDETDTKLPKTKSMVKGILPSVTFKAGGGLVANQASKFAAHGIKTGDYVQLKRSHNGVPKDAVGKVTKFDVKGMAFVDFHQDENDSLNEDKNDVNVTAGVVEKCKQPKKRKLEKAPEVVLPDGICYKLTDCDHEARCNLVGGALYKLLVGCTTGTNLIRCVREDPTRAGEHSLVAASNIKKGTLCLIPYNHKLLSDKPDTPCAKVELEIKVDEKITDTHVFWCPATTEVIGNTNQEPPLPNVLNPYWWTPTSKGDGLTVDLVHVAEEVELPMSMTVGKNSCISKASARLPLKIKFMALTNDDDIAKGTRLTINGSAEGWVFR